MHRKRTFTELFNERPGTEALKNMPRLPVLGILENIRSMHNVGSIFRTADALRMAGLFLTGYTPEPPRKEIDKTALGATETVPWKKFEHSRDAINTAQEKGFTISVLEQTTKSRNIYEIEIQKPLAIVFGNEVWGVSDEIVEQADLAIEIPQFGNKQSLNVSVAFGVAVYTLLANYPQSKWLKDQF